MTKILELTPQHDSAKSFYKKAHKNISYEDNTTELLSYRTVVAKINHSTNTVEVYGTYGTTTLRHIKEFLKQYGFKAETKKQIETDYMEVSS